MPKGIYDHYKIRGKKRPEHSKWMKENSPMKRPEVSKKSGDSRKGVKRPDLIEWNKTHKGEKSLSFGKPGYWKGKTNSYTANSCKLRVGARNPMYGKKNTGSSEYMRNGGAGLANSFIVNPSKPQVHLYERIKIFYPSAVLNYPFLNYSIDIAIPELKIAIEYDEPYWHQGREENDAIRQQNIEAKGWKFIRYYKLPSDEELEKSFGIVTSCIS